MHGSHLIKELRTYQLHARLEELGADNHGEETAKDEHGKAKPEVERADIFVVGGKQPTSYAFCRTMCHYLILLLALFVVVNIDRLNYVTHIITPSVSLVSHDGSEINFVKQISKCLHHGTGNTIYSHF